MQKNSIGFTLIELLVSIFILSLAIMGYLRVDLSSQRLLQETATAALLQHYKQQFYELVQSSNPDVNCPACTTLQRNQTILFKWQTALSHAIPKLSLHYTIIGQRNIKLTFCKPRQPCHDFIMQV